MANGNNGNINSCAHQPLSRLPFYVFLNIPGSIELHSKTNFENKLRGKKLRPKIYFIKYRCFHNKAKT